MLSKINQFIRGNYLYYKNRLFGAPAFQQEQTLYRLYLCKDDCLVENACKYCSCPPAKKSWVTESCNNGERFPDKMDKAAWDKFKQDNNIDMEKIKEHVTL